MRPTRSRQALLLVCALAASVAIPHGAPAQGRAPARACPAYGPGFNGVPGTSTCIRVSGRVRTEADTAFGRSGSGGGAPPTIDTRVDLDTRSGTEYGPVRTFLRAGAGRR